MVVVGTLDKKLCEDNRIEGQMRFGWAEETRLIPRAFFGAPKGQAKGK